MWQATGIELIALQTLVLCWLLVPAVVANMAPVVFGNSLGFINAPVSVRLFGDHKTWRGLIVATLTGGVVYIIQAWAQGQFEIVPADTYTRPIPYYYGFIIGLIAILGDLVKSGLKRAYGFKPGAIWFPFDQLDFIVPSLLIAQIFLPFWPASIFALIVLTLLMHPLINRLAYMVRLKDRPW